MTLDCLNPQFTAEYLNLPALTAEDTILLDTLTESAISFICGYTGREREELNDFEDITVAALVLISDGWDNRSLYIDKSNMNKMVETTLGMHSVNLI